MMMKDKRFILAGVLLLIFVSGCATAIRSTDWPEPSEFGQGLPTYPAPLDSENKNSAEEFEEPTGEITLSEAFAAALLNNPRLAGYAWTVRVREAQSLQTSLLPNPEIEIEVEEFGGSGDLSGFDATETTILFSQLIELGQKRQKRTSVAQLNQDLAAWDYEAARVSVLTDVSRALINVLSFQERNKMMQQNLDLANKVYGAIEKRVNAGAASPLDLTKARVEVAKERIELQRNQRDLKSARIQLATTWGSEKVQFTQVKGNFSTLSVLPSIETLSERIAQNPQVARWAAEIIQRKAEIEYEESKTVSDMEIGLGVRRLEELDDVAAVFNISIPLTVFNRNQGSIREANYELEVAHHLKREAELQINTKLSRSYEKLSGAFEEIKALEAELLPAAKQAYDDTHTAYTEGKVGYLQVLDAQRTLFEARSQHLEALVIYNTVAVEIEGLIGLPLSAMN